MSQNPNPDTTKFEDLVLFVIGAGVFALPLHQNLLVVDAYLGSRFGRTELPASVTPVIDFWLATFHGAGLGHSQWACVTLGLGSMLFALWRAERRHLQSFFGSHSH